MGGVQTGLRRVRVALEGGGGTRGRWRGAVEGAGGSGDRWRAEGGGLCGLYGLCGLCGLCGLSTFASGFRSSMC